MPHWWPDHVDFRSPNNRKHGHSSLSVYDIDDVLSCCQEYAMALSGSNVAETGESVDITV